jgi:hypothetical protein
VSVNFIFANIFNVELSVPVTSTGQTTLTINSTTNAPTITAGQIWVVVLNDAATQTIYEICYATSRTGNVLTVLRGQEGTAATTWLAGDNVYAPDTAAILNNFALVNGSSSTNFATAALTSTSINATGAVSGASFAASGSITSTGLVVTGNGSFSSLVQGNGVYATNLGSPSTPAGIFSGALIAQSSSSTGGAWLGGAVSSVQLDYGVTNAGALTISKATFISGGLSIAPTINSTTVAAFVPPAYANSGGAMASTVHIVQGTITGTGAAQTVTLSGSAVFANTSYFVIANVATTGASANPIVVSSSSFTVNGTPGQQIDYFAFGA